MNHVLTAAKLIFAVAVVTATATLASIAPASAADPKVTYVGLGRYTCSGNSTTCAQVDAHNRAQADRDRAQHERDQDRANRYVEESRRREEETRRRYQ